jgi:L-fuconolactonase
MRIDAHHHYWQYDPKVHAWISEEMAPLRRSFLPSDLAPLLKQSEFSGAVLVQVMQEEAENEWFLELAAQHSFIRGVVGWVDLQAADVAERLARFAAHPLFKGVRHQIQGEPDPGFMQRPAFRRGIRALEQAGLTYDFVIFPHQIPEAIALADAFPNQRFVLDHLGKPPIRTREWELWAKQIMALGQRANVYAKVSGLVTEADWHTWQPADLKPYLQTALDAFGPDRLMFGSDWPVCLLAAHYEDVLRVAEDFFASLSAEEQNKVFGLNAIQFYQL